MARLRGERRGPAEYGVEEPPSGSTASTTPKRYAWPGFDHLAAEDQAGRLGQTDQPW